MKDQELEIQADNLIHKIKHYLITTMGLTSEDATDEEFYRALSSTLREEIMINWTATKHSYQKKKARLLNYLCMEYLPGKLLGSTITSMEAMDMILCVMKKMGRDLSELTKYEPEASLGNGGLGRLASCMLDSFATQQYPAIGYGLRYHYGIFNQEIWDGVQVERPDIWLLRENPWEFRRDDHAVAVNFSGRTIPTKNKNGEETFDIADYEEVRALAYDLPIVGYNEQFDFNVVTLRLWSTKESPRNFQLQRYNAGQLDQASENTSLTDVLYPNDNNELGKRTRLKQEFLLSSASIQDIIKHHVKIYGNMQSFADKIRIQINDTHPALVIPELIRLLIKPFDFTLGQAWEIVKTCCGFTNHSILRESLEEWNQNRLQYLLPRQYKIIERLNLDFCNSVRKKFPGDEDRVRRMSFIEAGQVDMAFLSIYGSHRVNGVSEMHTEILKKGLFKDFYDLYPEKFINVTNGVTPRRWVAHANPRLAEFLTKRIGKKWITDFTQIKEIAKFASDPVSQQEFIDLKKANKRDLIVYLQRFAPIRDSRGKIIHLFAMLGDDALFDIHAKRIHEYKRQLLKALHLIMTYHELKADPGARKIKRMVLFAGKAAPGYEAAKHIIHLIFCVARKINNDPDVSRMLRVAFVENFNVSRAEALFSGADLSEQISTAGFEASGTGNMKLAMNGALTIATDDGANAEMRKNITNEWWPFGFGKTVDENEKMHRDRSYNPWDIYMHNIPIKNAVDALRDRSFAENDNEHNALSSLYQLILDTGYPDRFFVLNDLQSYYDTQKKVEDLYSTPNKWAECVLHNIAGMGNFSIDEAMYQYAKEIWQLEKCPVDIEELKKIRQEYNEYDKCRIF